MNSRDSQNLEEEEDLIEQQRRQEELNDLLHSGIQAFTYDDQSPANSCHVSTASVDHISCDSSLPKMDTLESLQNYRNVPPEDQFKYLYEVRTRELKSLKEEFTAYKEEKTEEISTLRKKKIISEAEIRQLQISLANVESLLVEKTAMIQELQVRLSEKDDLQTQTNQKLQDCQQTITAQKAVINELNFQKHTIDPFNEAKSSSVSNMEKSQQEKIIKLETLVNELHSKINMFESDKSKYIERETHLTNEIDSYKTTIEALNEQLRMSQVQCRDLFILGENIKKESDHFKERLRSTENPDNDVEGSELDDKSLYTQLLRCRRWLCDKDAEIATLKQKLKLYNEDMLFYFKCKQMCLENQLQPCNVKEHMDQLCYLQIEWAKCKQSNESLKLEVTKLNTINRELEDKIEEMLQQTRNDIQNLSQKYSLPQLEMMSMDLKNAQNELHTLTARFESKDKENKKLEEVNEQLQKYIKQLVQSNEVLKATLNENQSDIEKLRHTSDMETKLSESQKEIAHLSAQIKQMTELKDLLAKENDDLLKRINVTNEENFELNKNVMALQAQIERLELELGQCQSGINMLQQSKSKLELNLSNLVEKVDSKTTSSDDEDAKWNEKILGLECKLQAQMEEETLKEIQRIEETYKAVCVRKNNEIEKLKENELKYRKHLGSILSQTSQKVSIMEEENHKLKMQMAQLINDFDRFRKTHSKDDGGKVTTELERMQKLFKEKESQWKTCFENLKKHIITEEKEKYQRVQSLLISFERNNEEFAHVKRQFDGKLKTLKGRQVLSKTGKTRAN